MINHLVIIIVTFTVGIISLGLLDAGTDAVVNLLSMLMGYTFGAIGEHSRKDPK